MNSNFIFLNGSALPQYAVFYPAIFAVETFFYNTIKAY
jgi:hypothetical protein